MLAAPGGPPPERDQLVAMATLLHHRGPDAQGIYRDRWCGLAHTRLAIIDLAGGAQPMRDADGDCVIAYNGEVFNFRELRDELAGLGYAFRTSCDTEVVIQAYRAWGEAALAKFNGQFAFALWNRRTRTLVVARDRLGVRPLYVAEHAGRVYFASEVKALLGAVPSLPRALDPAGIAETFTFWTVVAPRSVFAGIAELPPGHVRTYTPHGTEERAYWRADLSERFTGSLADDAH